MLKKTGITHSSKEIFDLVKHFGPGKNVLTKPKGDFFYDEWELLPVYNGTSLGELFYNIGPVGEARINVMKPGECYTAHADIDDRYHLTLESEQSYLTDIERLVTYPCVANDILYEMDAGRLHTASNYGYKDRYELVIRKLLNKIDLQEPTVVTCKVENPPYNLRYLFDRSFSCLLNRLNKDGLISDFKKISDFCITFQVEQFALQEVLNLKQDCGFEVLIDYD